MRDHFPNGKELLLFQKVKRDGSIRFLGTFYCAGYDIRLAPDTSGTMRDAIVFQLLPIEDFGLEREKDEDIVSSSLSLKDRQLQAYEASKNKGPVSHKQVKSSIFARSATVRNYALVRANGMCELCDAPAPFLTASGRPFLEVHHILRLSDGGPDRPDKVAAICPNCHRSAHHAKDRNQINDELLEKVRQLEKSILASSACEALPLSSVIP
jgi:5-methylcytosine-specific restriction protein A